MFVPWHVLPECRKSTQKIYLTSQWRLLQLVSTLEERRCDQAPQTRSPHKFQCERTRRMSGQHKFPVQAIKDAMLRNIVAHAAMAARPNDLFDLSQAGHAVKNVFKINQFNLFAVPSKSVGQRSPFHTNRSLHVIRLIFNTTPQLVKLRVAPWFDFAFGGPFILQITDLDRTAVQSKSRREPSVH